MKNSLVNKIKEGAKKLGKKTILPLAFVAGSYMASTQNVDAQNRQKYPENHSHNKEFYTSKGNSEYSIEEIVFHNQITDKDERFYMGFIDKDKYENDLDFVSLDVDKTIPKMNLKTGVASELKSEEGTYTYFPEKLANGDLVNKVTIENLHISDWCDDQIRESAGAQKGEDFISVKSFYDLLPEHQRLSIPGIGEFIYLTVAEQNQIEGKTNHYLIPIDGKHEIGFDPINKKPIIYGEIYRGVLQKDQKEAKTQPTGIGSDLGRDESYDEKQEEKKESEHKVQRERQPANAYIISGINGNSNFVEGNLGIGYGPVAIVGSLGKAKDERVKEITTNASLNTGRYGYGTEDNTDVSVKDIDFEVHPLYNKKVSPFAGIGINKWDYTTTISEEIRDSDDNTIKQNKNSGTNSDITYNALTGVNFKINDKIQIGGQINYDFNKEELSGGARITINLK